MTRLLHGFTILAGTCALTFVVGCGGSSTPKVNCDGGLCGDARRDTSGTIKHDGSTVTPGPDGSTVAPGPDGSTVTPGPDGSTVTPGPDGSTVTPGPDGSTVTPGPDGSTVTPGPDGPTATPDGPAVTPHDGPAVTPPDGSADVEEGDTTAVKHDAQPLLDVRLDVPSPDVAQDMGSALYDLAPDGLEDALEAGDATEAGEAG